jgi:hypothetical protein
MTIRIFVGCAPNHDDAESQAVLEYTIRKHASRPVEITWMKLSRDPVSPFYGWDTSTWATPFSGFRYAVPALCGYEGRAIYMDSDVICMADVAELIDADVGRHHVMARSSSRLCVSLWNCAEFAAPWIDDLRRGMRPPILVKPFPADQNWNCLDGDDYADLRDTQIKAIHYTSMPHQPHLVAAGHRLHAAGLKHWFDGQITRHWRGDLYDLFFSRLVDAELNGYTVESYCQDEPYGLVQKGSNAGLRGEVPKWGR